jgi:hypothetical protein
VWQCPRSTEEWQRRPGPTDGRRANQATGCRVPPHRQGTARWSAAAHRGGLTRQVCIPHPTGPAAGRRAARRVRPETDPQQPNGHTAELPVRARVPVRGVRPDGPVRPGPTAGLGPQDQRRTGSGLRRHRSPGAAPSAQRFRRGPGHIHRAEAQPRLRSPMQPNDWPTPSTKPPASQGCPATSCTTRCGKGSSTT